MNKHEVKLRLEASSFDNSGSFEGFASVFGNTDSYGDVVVQGAFARTIKNRTKANGKADFPILWNHNPNEPLGVTTSMVEDSKGLKVTGQLNLEVQRAREIYSLMKQGAISGLSIGYTTIKDKIVEGKRNLLEVRLYEWSPVTFPANEAAGITSVKSVLEAKADSDVASLSFSHEEWERDEVLSWAEANGFKSTDLTDGERSFSLKQFDPSEGSEFSVIRISGVSGISATLCKKKPTALEPSGDKLVASDIHAMTQALKSYSGSL